jgi:hypothetical protein
MRDEWLRIIDKITAGAMEWYGRCLNMQKTREAMQGRRARLCREDARGYAGEQKRNILHLYIPSKIIYHLSHIKKSVKRIY